MIIAIPYENGQVFGHFGHTKQFRLYTVTDGVVTAISLAPTNGSGHGALSAFLAEHGVDTLICGGIGGGARDALGEVGIRIYAGVTGDADRAVAMFLAGKLDYDPNARCDHHDHAHGDGHTCGDHDCGGTCHHE